MDLMWESHLLDDFVFPREESWRDYISVRWRRKVRGWLEGISGGRTPRPYTSSNYKAFLMVAELMVVGDSQRGGELLVGDDIPYPCSSWQGCFNSRNCAGREHRYFFIVLLLHLR